MFGRYAGEDLSTEQLLIERFVCVLDASHPLADAAALTIQEYLGCRHLVVDVADGLQPDVDRPLAEAGDARLAAITVPYHAVVPELLSGTDLVATLPSRLVAAWPKTHDFRLLAAPAEVGEMSYQMIWHPAFDHDRRHNGGAAPLGAAKRARTTVAVVDFELDDEQRAWVAEVRQFLRDNVTAALRAEMAEHGLEFQGGELSAFRRKIGEKGWFGLNWPREYGGLGLGRHAPAPADERVRVLGRARTRPDGHLGGADDHAARHRAEQEGIPAAIARGEIVCAVAIPSRTRAPTWPACAPARFATVTSG